MDRVFSFLQTIDFVKSIASDGTFELIKRLKKRFGGTQKRPTLNRFAKSKTQTNPWRNFRQQMHFKRATSPRFKNSIRIITKKNTTSSRGLHKKGTTR